MLRTKSITAPASPEDGLRISIMSRHTLEDGTSSNPDIASDSYEEHWKKLAPSPELIGSYYKRGLSWDDFENQFTEELKTQEKQEALHQLISLALVQSITIMCIEDTPKQCHRRIIAEKCKETTPELIVVIE